MRVLLLGIIVHLFVTAPQASLDRNAMKDIMQFNLSNIKESYNASIENEIKGRYENMLVLIPNSRKKSVSPLLRNDFLGFKEAIGFRESSGKYDRVNKYGYVGKYQFGIAALNDLGIYNKQKFLNSPQLQEKAFIALCSLNKYKLRNYIERYDGVKLNGVTLTQSGMLAAAHLVGPGAVIDFIKSNGRTIKKDGLGTSVVDYLVTFQGYDVSVITASKSIKLRNS